MSKSKPNPLKGQWGGSAGLMRAERLLLRMAAGDWPDAATEPYEALAAIHCFMAALQPGGRVLGRVSAAGRRYRPRLPKKSERERCGAFARSTGKPCQAPCCRRPDGRVAARCRMHGGLSTGPKTPEGKRRALANLEQYRRK